MIEIYPTPNADTRTAETSVTEEELLASSRQHIGDVRKAMDWMRERLAERAEQHDHTKIELIEEFTENFNQVIDDKSIDFTQLGWYDKHITIERHHLTNRVPDDVDLFDVMERIADIVMAGMGRAGKFTPDDLPVEILQQAYINTCKKLQSQIVIVQPDGLVE